MLPSNNNIQEKISYQVTIKLNQKILATYQTSLQIDSIGKFYENWMLMNNLTMSTRVACPKLFFENSKS